jgi:hypothetical protein
MSGTHAKMLVIGVATAAAEVGAFYVAAYLKGEDHSFLPFALFFPVPFLFSIPSLHLLPLAVITMLIQFPVYGYLLGQAWIRGHLRRTVLRLSAFHSLSAVASVCSLLIERV